MCLIAWRWSPDAPTPILWAANRDEFAHRATQAQSVWAFNDRQVLSGLDLTAQPDHNNSALRGTWAGVNNRGKFAWLTNIRSPNDKNPTAPSRGALVSDYLTNDLSPQAMIAQIGPKSQRYNGFNLVLGQVSVTNKYSSECWHYHSRRNAARALPAGVYGLSNADLDTPWPKTLDLVHAMNMAGLSVTADGPQAAHEAMLLDALSQRRIYEADRLPSTGLSIEREQVLSAAFIAAQLANPLAPLSPEQAIAYGTRSSSVAWYHAGQFTQIEHTFNATGAQTLGSKLHLTTLG